MSQSIAISFSRWESHAFVTNSLTVEGIGVEYWVDCKISKTIFSAPLLIRLAIPSEPLISLLIVLILDLFSSISSCIVLILSKILLFCSLTLLIIFNYQQNDKRFFLFGSQVYVQINTSPAKFLE